MSEHLRPDDDIARHRCGAPVRMLRDRRLKLGKLHTCPCGRTYRLEASPFGRRWSVIAGPDDVPIIADIRPRALGRLA